MSDAEKQIKEDLMQLVVNQPFFASIILKQKLEVTDMCNTAAVNGVVLRVNPEWFLALDPYERMTVLAHEALHLTNKHNLRRGNRDHKMWNVACDMAINKHLTRHPFKLPSEGAFDKLNEYGDGADAEYIYSKLMEEIAEEVKKHKERQESDESDEPNGGSPTPSDHESIKQSVLDKYADQAMGDVEDHPIGVESKEELMNAQDILTNMAMNQAKKRGKMPASIEQEIRKSYEKKVSWRDLLSRWIEGMTQSDYNWLYPHDVHLQNDLIMPSMHSEAYSDIVVGIDTSASMSEEMLRSAVTEVFNALEAYSVNGQEARICVVYCDCAVHKVEYITSPSQVCKPVGRGGTNYTPIFEYVSGNDIQAGGLIIITDGYCYVDPDDKPSMDVVWMLTEMDVKRFKPPFGDCIQIMR